MAPSEPFDLCRLCRVVDLLGIEVLAYSGFKECYVFGLGRDGFTTLGIFDAKSPDGPVLNGYVVYL